MKNDDYRTEPLEQIRHMICRNWVGRITVELRGALDRDAQRTARRLAAVQAHDHYAFTYAFGRRQAIWSTAAECVLCGTGHEYR